jgi:hypothetical protein
MTFATMADLGTMILCAAVLIQSVRMIRSLKAIRSGAITEVVALLDRSTGEARSVLSDLKVTLAHCSSTANALSEGQAITDELTVMIGIANASADRMADAANAARRQQAAA